MKPFYAYPIVFKDVHVTPERLRIYIACPYSKGDVAQNVAAAIHAGDYVAHRGHYPFIPVLTHFWHMIIPHPYEFWLEQDMEWLKVCDAILRLSGESVGADQEVAWAQEHGLMIYHSVFEIPDVNKAP